MQPCNVFLSLNKDSSFYVLGRQMATCARIPGNNEDRTAVYCMIYTMSLLFLTKLEEYSLKMIWPLTETLLKSFTRFFKGGGATWLSAASELLRHVPWQHLPARAQARARTSPNARGCFKLACAPRVSRRWESGFLCACVSKKEVIILQNWQAAQPLVRCIPKRNCWKWTLHAEEAGRKNLKV